MKIALILSTICLVGIASSCRTAIPLDPNTMELSCRCMPHKYQTPGPQGCDHCDARQSSK
jgi:hypothetical protein